MPNYVTHKMTVEGPRERMPVAVFTALFGEEAYAEYVQEHEDDEEDEDEEDA